ncbi:MAG TPA: mandelate racemase/muconate lactonizing enzyme family protein [Limnochordia bacterium]|nr:mandelate racemase/muconate lactonizing enzyme family protein [Limnochordia bacterium]
MQIESVDFFYYKMPEVTTEADGSQDALLVRVRAGEHEGWGECDAAPLPSIAAWCCPRSHGVCRPVAESVLGRGLDDPADIGRINALVRENSLDLLQADHVLSGIDIALWDLLGKRLGVPAHELLGAQAVHPKRPYASVLFGDTPAETHAKAERIRSSGFRAAKFGWNRYGRGTAGEDAEQVAAARAGMGPDAHVMIDAGTVWKDDVPAAAARLAALHQAQVTWLEEPFLSDAESAYAELAAAEPRVPLAGGEGAHNFHMARRLIDAGGIGYVQIDSGRVGGITTSREVALYAAQKGVRYVNHTFTSMLALAASLCAYWDLEDSFICEYPVETKSLCEVLTHERIVPGDDGLIRPAPGPGLGVTPDLEALRPYRVDLRIELGGRVLYETPKS